MLDQSQTVCHQSLKHNNSQSAYSMSELHRKRMQLTLPLFRNDRFHFSGNGTVRTLLDGYTKQRTQPIVQAQMLNSTVIEAMRQQKQDAQSHGHLLCHELNRPRTLEFQNGCGCGLTSCISGFHSPAIPTHLRKSPATSSCKPRWHPISACVGMGFIPVEATYLHDIKNAGVEIHATFM